MARIAFIGLGAPVLARLHSACFTGDVLGSLKCDCGPQLHADVAAERLQWGRTHRPVGQGVSPRIGDRVDLLVRTRALGDVLGAGPAVGLHPGEHLIDLLVTRLPKVADGRIEPAGEVVARRRPFGEGDQDRVFEGHATNVLCTLLLCN